MSFLLGPFHLIHQSYAKQKSRILVQSLPAQESASSIAHYIASMLNNLSEGYYGALITFIFSLYHWSVLNSRALSALRLLL